MEETPESSKTCTGTKSSHNIRQRILSRSKEEWDKAARFHPICSHSTANVSCGRLVILQALLSKATPSTTSDMPDNTALIATSKKTCNISLKGNCNMFWWLLLGDTPHNMRQLHQALECSTQHCKITGIRTQPLCCYHSALAGPPAMFIYAGGLTLTGLGSFAWHQFCYPDLPG